MTRSIFLLAIIALAGCTTSTARYPSLLPRTVEAKEDLQPVRMTPVSADDPALAAQVSDITASLAASAVAFAPATERATAVARAAKGASVGSEPWLSAQSAVSELESIRAQSTAILSDIEHLAIDRAASGLPAYPLLDAVRDRAEAQVAAQQAVIDSLQRQLAGI